MPRKSVTRKTSSNTEASGVDILCCSMLVIPPSSQPMVLISMLVVDALRLSYLIKGTCCQERLVLHLSRLIDTATHTPTLSLITRLTHVRSKGGNACPDTRNSQLVFLYPDKMKLELAVRAGEGDVPGRKSGLIIPSSRTRPGTPDFIPRIERQDEGRHV